MDFELPANSFSDVKYTEPIPTEPTSLPTMNETNTNVDFGGIFTKSEDANVYTNQIDSSKNSSIADEYKYNSYGINGSAISDGNGEEPIHSKKDVVADVKEVHPSEPSVLLPDHVTNHELSNSINLFS